ncbi:MAG: hypothetical protein MHPSP_000672, partial [Paramarteilia canceri]
IDFLNQMNFDLVIAITVGIIAVICLLIIGYLSSSMVKIADADLTNCKPVMKIKGFIYDGKRIVSRKYKSLRYSPLTYDKAKSLAIEKRETQDNRRRKNDLHNANSDEMEYINNDTEADSTPLVPKRPAETFHDYTYLV